jgi:amino acid transporter
MGRDFTTFVKNMHAVQPNPHDPPQTIPYYIFYGYAAALLGVSGFETSANFIEEQAEGVFPKTLRNMWIGVATFNPVLSFLSLGTLPMSQIVANPNSLLASMGDAALNAAPGHPSWLSILVSVDGCLVLACAVLTSYVGVTGLIRRMALDRCLPQFLLQTNRVRGTNHWIILTFFVATSSLYWIVGGDVTTLEGKYKERGMKEKEFFFVFLFSNLQYLFSFLLSIKRCLFNVFPQCDGDV